MGKQVELYSKTLVKINPGEVPRRIDLADIALRLGKVKPAEKDDEAVTKGQMESAIKAADYIPYEDTNYRLVQANGTVVENGTALLVAIAAAKLLTPNGSALSATNRAVVYLLVGTYNLDSSDIALGNYVDIIGIGDVKDITITSTNTTGTIQIANTNNYVLKNLTISNSGSGGSITHNASQTDNGIWENLILNAANTFDTTFTGDYSYITGVVSNILNGSITGKVYKSSFQESSCGSGTADIVISGTIKDCVSLSFCFGYSTIGNVTISGNIKNCDGLDYCFGVTVATSTISGLIDNCSAIDYSFGYGSSIVTISGTIKNCSVTGIRGFGWMGFGGTCTISGTILSCNSTTDSFGSGAGIINITSNAIILDCIATGKSFGYSSLNNVSIAGKIQRCISQDNSFGSVTTGGTPSISGIVQDCIGTTLCFGNTTSTGKLINCTRTSGYGVHLGTIERCSFSENDAVNPVLTVGAGVIVKYSTIYQAGAAECIDGGAISASIYHCSMNKDIKVSITNIIGTPANVVDADIII